MEPSGSGDSTGDSTGDCGDSFCNWNDLGGLVVDLLIRDRGSLSQFGLCLRVVDLWRLVLCDARQGHVSLPALFLNGIHRGSRTIRLVICQLGGDAIICEYFFKPFA